LVDPNFIKTIQSVLGFPASRLQLNTKNILAKLVEVFRNLSQTRSHRSASPPNEAHLSRWAFFEPK
jgi:hypothetical protein